MASSRVSSKENWVDLSRIESLLLPITVVLRAAGVPKNEAEQVFSSLYSNTARVVALRKIEHIRHSGHFEKIVANWMRDNRFVDKRGQARLLPMRGPNGFSALVKSVNPRLRVDVVRSVFLRYRTMRRTRKNAYELLTPYFAVCTPHATAFEPFAHFLAEASRTLERMLIPDSSRTGDAFWRMVESTNLSDAGARKFTTFIRKRSQTFLEEVDEWLEANEQPSNARATGRRPRRMGLGLFSISSNFKDWRQSSA